MAGGARRKIGAGLTTLSIYQKDGVVPIGAVARTVDNLRAMVMVPSHDAFILLYIMKLKH